MIDEIHNPNGNNKISFESFYNQYYTKACLYVKRKIQNQQDAEDVACDVFLYCYDHFSEYDEQKASIGTWLYMILNSRVKNYYRDKKNNISLDLIDDYIDMKSSYLEQAAEFEEMRKILAEALDSLSEIQKMIVVYRYFQDRSTAETAKMTGITEGNVRTQLTRALARIRKYLNAQGYEKG